ncbi:Mediator of RNA polymerase II transcription subunit 6 [Tulasnella sp. 332]|nr:Mediator of RNA polymerase II transcription subunit 6 [Tulasnella sp. 332]
MVSGKLRSFLDAGFRASAVLWHLILHDKAKGGLTETSVLDFFMESPFADHQSNNAVLRMQLRHTGMPLEDEPGKLRNLTGIEFAVVHAMPPDTFVIQKRERLSPHDVRPLAAFFVLYNRIYAAPDIYSVISGRLRNTLSYLGQTLDDVREHRPDFNPRKGYSWDISLPVSNESKDKDAEKEGLGTKAKTKVSLISARNQSEALGWALETTSRYAYEITQTSSVVPILPGPDAGGQQAGAVGADGTVLMIEGGAGSNIPLPTPSQSQTQQSVTVAASSGAYTLGTDAAVGGSTPRAGGAGRKSVSSTPRRPPGTPAGSNALGVAGAVPGQITQGASVNGVRGAPGPPGIPGQGKKKKRRQLKAGLGGKGWEGDNMGGGAASPGADSPMDLAPP